MRCRYFGPTANTARKRAFPLVMRSKAPPTPAGGIASFIETHPAGIDGDPHGVRTRLGNVTLDELEGAIGPGNLCDTHHWTDAAF